MNNKDSSSQILWADGPDVTVGKKQQLPDVRRYQPTQTERRKESSTETLQRAALIKQLLTGQ